MYVSPAEERHDPVTARPARTLRELADDPRDWWEAPGAANDQLIDPEAPPRRPAWRRALFAVVAFVGLVTPVVLVVEKWVRP